VGAGTGRPLRRPTRISGPSTVAAQGPANRQLVYTPADASTTSNVEQLVTVPLRSLVRTPAS
jgi:hypothetical protein